VADIEWGVAGLSAWRLNVGVGKTVIAIAS
jgi:hypothetical protein